MYYDRAVVFKSLISPSCIVPSQAETAAKVEKQFPGTTTDGKVDRKKLSEVVVGSKEGIEELQNLVHPLGKKKGRRRKRKQRRELFVLVLDTHFGFCSEGTVQLTNRLFLQLFCIM